MVDWWVALLTPVFMLVIWALESRRSSNAEKSRRRFEQEQNRAAFVKDWEGKIRTYLAVSLWAGTDDEKRQASRDMLICASYIKDHNTPLYKYLKEFFEMRLSASRRRLDFLCNKITKELNKPDQDIVASP